MSCAAVSPVIPWFKRVLPKFYLHVKCATRGKNTLDHVTLTMHTEPYPSPTLASQTDRSLLLSPAYTPFRLRARPITKTVITWPDDALTKLQDCFQQTDWDLFEQQELKTQTGHYWTIFSSASGMSLQTKPSGLSLTRNAG